MTILTALPLAGLLLCLAVAVYLTWRNYESDRLISVLLHDYIEITDAASQIEFENVIRQLKVTPSSSLENLMHRQTSKGLESVQQTSRKFPADLQVLSATFVRSATELKNAMRTENPIKWESAENAFRQQRYLLSREIAENLVRAGEIRQLSGELRHLATLKIANDLVDRVMEVQKWHPNALTNTTIAESLLNAIRQNLGILSDELQLDEGKLRTVRGLARDKGIALTQSDIDLETPTEGALFAVTDYYRPQIHEAYLALNGQLEAAMAGWVMKRSWISGLSVLAWVIMIFLAAVITRAVYRSIAEPLKELATAAHRMEKGDLTITLDPYQTDEIGKVAHGFASLNTTVQGLNDEFTKLEDAANAGQTNVRGNRESLQGEWRHLIDGMNSTLDRLDVANSKVMQAQRMEVYAKMSGGIAHQFNNLLTVIMGHVELQSAKDAAHAKALEPVVQAGRRAKSLVSQLQTLGTENRLQLKPVSLARALEQLASSAQQILPDKISISVETPEDNAYVLSDAGTLQQSFMNLMLNARDALVDGGHVKVLVGKVTISNTEIKPVEWIDSGTFLGIEFRDDGPGIPADLMGRVFEPFFSTKDHGEGSGLGLSMIYGFARQCGGWAAVESSAAQGASVTIYLPKTKAPAADELPQFKTEGDGSDKPKASIGKGTILLVEDDLLVCRLTHTMLKKLGYTVIEAHDGKEGLDALEKHHDDLTLVVSDVLMPHLTGPQMIQNFQESRQLACGVLFVTGYSADELPGQIGELGENFARLNKPFSLDGLQSKMSELLALSS